LDQKTSSIPPARSTFHERRRWSPIAADEATHTAGASDTRGEYTPVITSWTYPSAFDGVTPAHMHRVRDMAANGNYRKSDQAKGWIGYAVAEVLGLDPSDEADKKQIKAILKKWFADGVLDTKERYDEQQRKNRPFVVPGNWNEQPDQDGLNADESILKPSA
jgi:hypothetical protein